MAAVMAEHIVHGSRFSPPVFPGLGREQRLVGGQGPVRPGIQEGIDRAGVGRHDLADPPLAVGVLVQALRCTGQFLVDSHDLTGDRRIDLRDRLGRLDLAQRSLPLQRRAHSRQVDEDDVAQRVLRVVGDADPDAFVLRIGPTRGRRNSEVRRARSCLRTLPEPRTHCRRPL